MKNIILCISSSIFLIGCGAEKSNPSHEVGAILIQTKNSSGDLEWRCVCASGGGAGNVAAPAYLEIWEPDNQGRCFKPEKDGK